MTKPITQITVTRKQAAGWYIYQSEDLPGLFVANPSDQAAYDALPEAIQTLIFLDEGLQCDVSHALSYREFLFQSRASTRAIEELRKRTAGLMDDSADILTFLVQTNSEVPRRQ